MYLLWYFDVHLLLYYKIFLKIVKFLRIWVENSQTIGAFYISYGNPKTAKLLDLLYTIV